MANPRRIQRIQSRIRQDVAELLLTDLKDPRLKGLISITRVAVSKDLSFARVYYSVLGSPADRRTVKRLIGDACGFIQSQVARGLQIRIAPRLSFHYDDSIEKESVMAKLIDEAVASDARPGDSGANQAAPADEEE